MRKVILLSIGVFVCTSGLVSADTFGTGDNQFEIDFVAIFGDASSANGTNISPLWLDQSYHRSFTDPVNDYRIGKFEITNDQWNTFANAYGNITGSPSNAYGESPTWTGANIPHNRVSWLEVAQFVNWLNIDAGYAPAYKSIGTIHTGSYTFTPWATTDTGYNASNPFRNSNAFYFLPTEDEWVKAAYWNGTDLQTNATIDNSIPIAGIDANYQRAVGQPWDVGSGNAELNGTYDMMGNVYEWLESPWTLGDYTSNANRAKRGAMWSSNGGFQTHSRSYDYVFSEVYDLGFRVASVPEPGSLSLLALGSLALIRKRQ